MFKNFKKIQIEGGYFEPSSGLDLFGDCLTIKVRQSFYYEVTQNLLKNNY